MSRGDGGDELLEQVRLVYKVLEEAGYTPVIVGSFALVLQGWLPPTHVLATKDVDIYVSDPNVAFDELVEKLLLEKGLVLSRSDAGGLYVETGAKRVEILYPIHDVYVPPTLLRHTVTIAGMRVLEAHATLVARALAGSQEELFENNPTPPSINPTRLKMLEREVLPTLDPHEARLLEKRLKKLLTLTTPTPRG